MKYHLDQEVFFQYEKESNYNLFTHEGYVCAVLRMNDGHLNGYVGIPIQHPIFGKSYSDKVTPKKEPVFNGNYIGLLCASLESNDDGEWALDMAINVHGGAYIF